MHQQRTLFFLMAFCLAGFLQSSAFSDDTTPATTQFKLKEFRAAQLSTFQSNRTYFSGVVLWTPSYSISEDFRLGLSLGASLLALRAHDIFVAPEYVLKASYQIDPAFSVDAGIGAQTWISNGGTLLQLEANGMYHLSEKFLSCVQQVFIGYVFIGAPIKSAHQIRVGVGISL